MIRTESRSAHAVWTLAALAALATAHVGRPAVVSAQAGAGSAKERAIAERVPVTVALVDSMPVRNAPAVVDVAMTERAQRFVGRELDVLVEGTSRTDPSRLRGRSRHNKTVNFSGLASPGDVVPVQITGATSQTLTGELSLLAAASAAG